MVFNYQFFAVNYTYGDFKKLLFFWFLKNTSLHTLKLNEQWYIVNYQGAIKDNIAN